MFKIVMTLATIVSSWSPNLDIDLLHHTGISTESELICASGSAASSGFGQKPGNGGGVDTLLATWTLNEAKSKIAAGATKSDTVKYEAVGDAVKVTVDGTDSSGKPVHIEWTGKFDGKDYPVVGDPTSDTRAYKKIDNYTFSIIGKKGEKVTMTAKIVVAADRKSRSVTTFNTNAMGKKMSSTAVYDKQ
jgi:hypothetical protein